MLKSKEADSTDAKVCEDAPTELVVFDDTVGASTEPDDYTKQFNTEKLNDYRQDIKLRKHFSWATYGLLCAWLVIVAGLLIWSSRSDEVLIALISGATIQVIGLYYIVLRYIFPSRGGSGENGS
ncbi:hypothetical protein [Pseudogemmobacter blasticus]|uniref:hypothetical protein n=1 Tax=Fuscovulum blasticum TaxID=1075 RepID=UPI0011B1D6F3|nr:hypothetical protein [Fuscovulum blasticum]